MAKTSTKKTVAKNRISKNGEPTKKPESVEEGRVIRIPLVQELVMSMTIVGTTPLMVNNKMGVAWMIAAKYDGGKSQTVDVKKLTPDEMYELAFYVLPDSKHDAPHPKARYGVPTSGIAKCFRKASRLAGITDNTTIGLINKGFKVHADMGGMCLLNHDGFIRDKRPVNIGSGQKTVPSIRHRPMFPTWSIDLTISYNPKVLSPEMICNLASHAGIYIGLCEMRAEKGQGECGSFVIQPSKRNKPRRADLLA